MSRRRLVDLVAVILLGVVVWGVVDGIVNGSEPDRVAQLTHQLKCPVCQGESVADSPSASARAIADEVRKQVAAGWSDRQVLDFYVNRFGSSILLSPPRSGSTLVLWIVPIVVGAAGIMAIAGMLRPGRARSTVRLGAVASGIVGVLAISAFGSADGEQPPALASDGSVPSGTAVRDVSQVTNEEMEAVIAKNPTIIGMRLALAERYLDAGAADKALPHTAAAIDLPASDQEYERALRLHGWTLALNNAPASGVQYLKAALSLSPTDRDALFFLAKVSFEGLHDTTTAKLALDELAKLPMDDTQRAVIESLRAAVLAALPAPSTPTPTASVVT